jgi:hypothetical protein
MDISLMIDLSSINFQVSYSYISRHLIKFPSSQKTDYAGQSLLTVNGTEFPCIGKALITIEHVIPAKTGLIESYRKYWISASIGMTIYGFIDKIQALTL